MRGWKELVRSMGLVLLFVAGLSCCLSVKNLLTERPPDSYEDKCIYCFVPYQVLPVQVKNMTGTARSRRMNPTRTVYKVYYRAVGGSGYRWEDEAVSKTAGQKIVEEKAAVERRVLGIMGENAYIAIEPELDAESYTAGLRRRYQRVLILSAAYILAWLTAQGVLLGRHALRS